jgi:hypothetical protein
VRISIQSGLFSGFNRVSIIPGDSLTKAASARAKTVNGPERLSVATKDRPLEELSQES